MRRILAAVLACSFAVGACDFIEGGIDTETTGSTSGAWSCPPLCLGDCELECIPSACWTIGDGCTIHNGHEYIGPNTDQQCGERMACISEDMDPAGGILGICAAPCSADVACSRGVCDLALGYCVSDGAPVAPIDCA